MAEEKKGCASASTCSKESCAGCASANKKNPFEVETNPNAHIIVKKSPKLMLKSASKDSIPIPKIAIILLIIPYLSSGLLYNIKPINGTITTFIAVKKAFFDAVV